MSFAGGSALFTVLPPFLIRPVYLHFPQAIITLMTLARSTASTASWTAQNAQCVLGYILVIVEFISQPEYKGLIPMFGIVNDGACLLAARNSNTYPLVTAYLSNIGCDLLTSLYVGLPLLASFCCSTDMTTQIPPSTI
jgi:hypothetical protein